VIVNIEIKEKLQTPQIILKGRETVETLNQETREGKEARKVILKMSFLVLLLNRREFLRFLVKGLVF
jgi:hypothetical protein